MADYVNYSGKGIGQYDSQEPWDNYVERLTGHFRSCKVANLEQRRDILISTCGEKTYGLMKSLLGKNVKPETKTYKQICELVQKHKSPTPPWPAERIKFLNRNRKVQPV